jgi:hypothetical protein
MKAIWKSDRYDAGASSREFLVVSRAFVTYWSGDAGMANDSVCEHVQDYYGEDDSGRGCCYGDEKRRNIPPHIRQ